MPLPLTYNWRNLMVRKLSTTLTLIVVGILVLVLSVLLSFAAGIRASLQASGSPLNLMVLKPGATAESTSIILNEEAQRIVQAPGIARDAAGRPLVSPEICVQTVLPRRTARKTPANVAVRGVEDLAFQVHDEIKMAEGRSFYPGALEVIVGQAARERYDNLNIGGQIALGRLSNRTFTVVGIFTANGGALESEIWAPRSIIADVYLRSLISSAVVRLESADRTEGAIAYINGPTVGLEARREIDYYDELTSKTQEIVILTTILVVIMAGGAVFAVANTMYAAVDGRRKEIAMLRTIGFSRGAIMTCFLMESLMITLIACTVGLIGSRFFAGSRQDFLSDTTWTVLAYELRLTPQILLIAFSVAVFVGVTGALAPALRASRTRIIEALRRG